MIFELSKAGRKAYKLPEADVETLPVEELIPDKYLNKDELDLPEVSEVDIVRHYTNLSNKNFGVDTDLS